MKNACIDYINPTVQDLSHPAETIWGVCSEVNYGIKLSSDSRKLTDQQILNQEDEPLVRKPGMRANQAPSPSGKLYQQSEHRNLTRFRLMLSKVKAAKAHTVT